MCGGLHAGLTTRGLVPIAALGEGTSPANTARSMLRSRASPASSGEPRLQRRSIAHASDHDTSRLRDRGDPGASALAHANGWDSRLGAGGGATQSATSSQCSAGKGCSGARRRIACQYQRERIQDHAKPIAVETTRRGAGISPRCSDGRRLPDVPQSRHTDERRRGDRRALHRFAQRVGLNVFRNGVGRPYDHVIASAQLYQLLLGLGMTAGKAAEKRVPASRACTLRARSCGAYLRGLFDTDGTVERRSGYPSICSASKRLIDEVQVALLNFGIVASKRAPDDRVSWLRQAILRAGDARRWKRRASTMRLGSH